MTAQQQNPFGEAPRGARRRWIRRALLVGAPLLAVGAVILATRRGAAATDAPVEQGHNHAAMAVAPAAQPVMLTADAARRIGVTYTTVAAGPVAKEIRTVGQVAFDETRVTTVSPKIEGWIERLYVNYTGQPVAAGAPLLAIYSPMLVTAQEELLLALRLARDVAGGSEEARRGASEMVASARRRLTWWDIPAADIARIERTGEVQRTLTLRAPNSGVVVTKGVLQGQRIMMGEALYRIADLSTVWVEGEVFEQDLAAVRVGMPVTATFEALPGTARHGRITYVYPTLNPDTRTAKVRVEFANPGLQLKPGMYATLQMDGANGAGGTTLSVPRGAVLSTGTRNLVFVRRPDGMLEPREVRVGAANAERIAVLAGLRAGETIVASATFLVDAESNLGSAMGGMGDMPGMDMTAPTAAPAAAPTARQAGTPAPAPDRAAPGHDPHAGMNHAGHQE